MSIETIHRIDRPFADGTIEVYGEPDMGWYEWRIVERGAVIQDTGRHGQTGIQYGSAGIALRDALSYDEPPKPQAPAVVPISWVPGRDAATENLAQAQRSLDILRGMAADLVNEAYNAKTQRRVINPDHPNGRLGMIYTDKRTAASEHIAQILNDAADKLLLYSHEIVDEPAD